MTASPSTLEALREMVRRDSGIILSEEQDHLVGLRLRPLVASCKLNTIDELVRLAHDDGTNDVRRLVVSALATNETSFFRDAPCFRALREVVVPELVRARSGERKLRVWSAACSSGQEIYSVAMLLADAFPHVMGWDVELAATDLCREMVERTKSGTYTQLEVNRGLPVRYLARFFEPKRSEWTLLPELRAKVSASVLNLTRPWPALKKVDLVLLRNVLIYFDDATKLAIMTRLRSVLAPDGFLVVGAAESPRQICNWFEAEAMAGGFVAYRHRPDAHEGERERRMR